MGGLKRMKFLHGVLCIFFAPRAHDAAQARLLGEPGCSRSRHFHSKGRNVRPRGKLSLLWLNFLPCREAELPNWLVADACHC